MSIVYNNYILLSIIYRAGTLLLFFHDKEGVGFEPTRRERPNGFQNRPLNQTWVTFHKITVLNTSDSLSQENLTTCDFS